MGIRINPDYGDGALLRAPMPPGYNPDRFGMTRSRRLAEADSLDKKDRDLRASNPRLAARYEREARELRAGYGL